MITLRRKEIRIPQYNLTEELINSISHGIGAELSIWGLVMLVIKASKNGALAVSTVTIFATTMILLYSMSCIYHAISPRVKAKKVLRVLDHCNVFLLVFGTVIPVALLGIQGYLGWLFFFIVASVTVIGILASVIDLDRFQVLEVICHLVNGWSVLFFSKSLISNIGVIGLTMIILGGVMYTLGSILYGIGSRKRYIHSVFHFFCIAGTVFHFLAIYLYIL